MTDQKHETNQSFYDRISRAYDLMADSNEHRAREAGEQALGLRPGERVLEIGYGTGNSLIDLAAMVGAAGHVAGIDVSPGMQAVAQEKINAKNLSERVSLTVGDARDLAYEEASFDAVFASFTLELFALPDIPIVLSEVSRVLKPGGRLGIVCMATVAEGQSASLLEKTYIWMHRHFPHIVDCQPIDAPQLVVAAGFAVKHNVEMQIWTMPVRIVVGVK